MQVHHPHCKKSKNHRNTESDTLLLSYPPKHDSNDNELELLSPEYRDHLGTLLTDEAVKAIDAIEYITEHLRKDNEYKRVREEWKFVSMVIDRLLLYVFFAVTAGGTMGCVKE